MLSEDTKDASPVCSAYFRGGNGRVTPQVGSKDIHKPPQGQRSFAAPNPTGSTMDLGDSHLHRRSQRTLNLYLGCWLYRLH